MVHFTGHDIILFVIGFFVPPLAVLFKQGCGWDFFINVALTIIGFIPGVLHAWWVIYQNRIDPRTHRRILPSDGERRTYVTVSQEEITDGSLPPGVKGYKVVEHRVTQVPTQVVQQQGGQSQTQTQSHTVQGSGGSTQHYTTTTTTSSGPVRTTKTTYKQVVEGNSSN